MKSSFTLYFDSKKNAQVNMLSMPADYISDKKDISIGSDFMIVLNKKTLIVRTRMTRTEFIQKYI